ncbi:SHOCT domain-containing protein [Clostridium frigoris]|uniref:SHOCT domain-containing protein n=2 Tax=Clostridium frigoris TaxID=205327 RepID=A0ABS6BWW7_9CLOT|nr:SHOCT domain-containing protein [Clostridium frigoris]
MMGGRFGFMFICIIIIAITVFVVYKLLKNNNIKDIGSRDNSLNILNERFARGEIDEEEYNNKKKLLSDHKKQ